MKQMKLRQKNIKMQKIKMNRNNPKSMAKVLNRRPPRRRCLWMKMGTWRKLFTYLLFYFGDGRIIRNFYMELRLSQITMKMYWIISRGWSQVVCDRVNRKILQDVYVQNRPTPQQRQFTNLVRQLKNRQKKDLHLENDKRKVRLKRGKRRCG